MRVMVMTGFRSASRLFRQVSFLKFRAGYRYPAVCAGGLSEAENGTLLNV